MFTIEFSLKVIPAPCSVQRKTKEEAESVYQQVITAVKSGIPQWIELTCDKMQGKKLAILTSEITAIQVYEKSASAGTAKPPGFLAAVSNEPT